MVPKGRLKVLEAAAGLVDLLLELGCGLRHHGRPLRGEQRLIVLHVKVRVDLANQSVQLVLKVRHQLLLIVRLIQLDRAASIAELLHDRGRLLLLVQLRNDRLRLVWHIETCNLDFCGLNSGFFQYLTVLSIDLE